MEAVANILRSPTVVSQSRVRVNVVIPGDPLSKQRPRMAMTKGGKVYTPKQTREAELYLKLVIRASAGVLIPDDRGSFGARIRFFTKNRQRRDIDNMVKLVFDACNGLVWKDDAQVEEVYAQLTRADETPRTEVLIYTLVSTTPYIHCEICGKETRVYPSWGARKYCSKTCAGRAQQNGSQVSCAGCGGSIYRADWRLRQGNGPFYCSQTCRTNHLTAEIECAHCHKPFRKPKCLIQRGQKYCTPECTATAQRERRLKTHYGCGTCASCGGRTSKKTYTRCNACKLQKR